MCIRDSARRGAEGSRHPEPVARGRLPGPDRPRHPRLRIRPMHTLVRLTSANLKSFTRDRAAMFWTLAFPLVFILLFGAIFSGGTSRFTVAWVDGDGSPSSTALLSNPALANVFTLKTYATADDAIAAMKQGDVRAVLVIPKGFGSAIASAGAVGGAALPLTVYTDPSNQQVSGTITGIVASLVGGFNQAASGRPPILAVQTQTVQSEAVSYTHLTLPTILALSLIHISEPTRPY